MNEKPCCGQEPTEPIVLTDVEAQEQLELEFHKDKETNAGARMDICRECPSLKTALNLCSECGCFMNIKVRIASASCPLGKW